MAEEYGRRAEIQWFPGHMASTKRMMEETIRLVDLIVEVVDARIPGSSRNPDLDSLWKRRPRIMALNKMDLADPEATAAWKRWYEKKGFGAVLLDSLKRQGISDLAAAAEALCREKRERERAKGMTARPIRMMVTGIPNVGKSTVINQLAGRSGAARTGNTPGVTRGRQWIKLRDGLELLDTPGMLWPKFASPEIGEKIALIGSIKDELLDMDDLACRLIPYLIHDPKQGLRRRFSLSEEELAQPPAALIETIGQKRGCKMQGGAVDFTRTARMLIGEFRSGKLGRITLEYPPDDPAKEDI